MDFMRKYLLKPQNSEHELLGEIRRTVDQLKAGRQWFETESDADLIESCVYQLESLEAKYRYLLRMAKERGLSCDAFTGEAGERQSA